jgi:hypothetical protein
MSSDPVIQEACDFIEEMCGVSCTPSTAHEVLKSGCVEREREEKGVVVRH